jgi:hypothetical protein
MLPGDLMEADGGRKENMRSTAGTLVFILIGPIAWALHLSVLYFSQSMLCAHGAADTGIAFGIGLAPFIIGVATAGALLLVMSATLFPQRASRLLSAGWGGETGEFNMRVMGALALLSSIGVAWGGLAALILPSCGQGR